jgi:uncharacterized protein YabE (DUF348 family)
LFRDQPNDRESAPTGKTEELRSVLRSVKYGLYSAVLAGLVAAPIAWSSVDKSVALVVDGQRSTVHTTASDVAAVLRDKGYKVGAHDLVAPSLNSSVKDGSTVVLRRGRLLHLNVDGRRTDVWTTAPTVAEALAQLGYTQADFVSVSRSRRLPLAATDIAIRTPQLVPVVHDGKRQQVTTTDATVAELLGDLEIAVGAADRVSPAATTPLTQGMTVQVQRVTTKLVNQVQSVPFPTQKVRAADLYVGTTKVVDPGKKGRVQVTYSVVYVDGNPVGRTKLRSVTLADPSPRVIKVGAKHVVQTATASSGGSSDAVGASPAQAQAIAQSLLQARGWGSDQFDCLVTLWNHESGWRVHAANPSGAYGIPQALPGSKMGSAGPDWQNNAETQIKWGLNYIASRYSTPCGAWSQWQANGGWY